MALPSLINKIVHQPGEEKREFLWALEIWDEGVKSAIWTIEEQKPKIVALGSHEAWEGGEDLVAATEKSFGVAQERFGQTEIPVKIIFGLPESWIEKSSILASKREFLDNLLKRLILTPLGFVSTFDAVVSHLKEVEGVPPSAIIINPTRMKVYLAVVDLGKVKRVEEVVRSENIGADVSEGLWRSQEESFPSRLLLFDGEDMEAIRQILLAYPWQGARSDGQKLPFLHFPKIEILPADFDIAAIILAGGGEVAQTLPVEEKEEEIQEEVKPDFGFVRGKDIGEEKPEERPPEVEEEISPPPLPFETLAPETPAKIKPSFSFLRKAKETLSNFFSSLPSGLPVLGGLAGFILLLLAGFLVFFWGFSRAQVTIFLHPQVKETELKLTVDPNQEELDEKNLVLPGEILETQVSGEKGQATTGQKTVGEKAKGEVTVYNRTDNQKVFAIGAVLVGPGGLKFTLSEETTVASKTPDLISGLDKWGEAKVRISAVEIGASSNLAANTTFSFKDYPPTLFLAKNEQAFSGGTSRQIQVVSEKDQETLLKTLTDELKEKGESQLLSMVPSGKKLIPESVSSKTVSSNFDHQVGDESQNLTLSLMVKTQVLSFRDESFLALVEKSLSDQIPSDYEFRKEEVENQFELEKLQEDGSALFKVRLKINLLPKLDQEKIAKSLAGKTVASAQKFLSELPSYARAEIFLSPKFSFFFPLRRERISLELRSQ